ncbi:MAG: hypothetical protein ACRDZ9_02560 [Acidimicrobiales bacterium]
MALTEPDLIFKARALAQAHPLTAVAKGWIDTAVDEQRDAQPMPDVGVWVNTALVAGYCVRRVEEDEAGLDPSPSEDAAAPADLGRVVEGVVADLRGERAGSPPLVGDLDRTVAVLDRIIATEVSKRTENVGDRLDYDARAELEEYITYWVVRGYALRVAELTTGALA